uniref:Ankyrin repeat protein n=1 Tax=Pithovirus LCPAC101 TaxID=2506586 RepID=A0A481Z256_9VIRU|nr:MAG: ankyrin repeat protein [Pithovirus LCPAC101]
MTTIIPAELYFHHMSEILDITDFARLLLADPDFSIYDTRINWLTMLHIKYPKYHEMTLKFLNNKATKEILYVLNIIMEEEKERMKWMENKNKIEYIRIINLYMNTLNMNELLAYSCKYKLNTLSKLLIENIDVDILFFNNENIKNKDGCDTDGIYNFEPLNETCKNCDIEMTKIILNYTAKIKKTVFDHNYLYYYTFLCGNNEYVKFIFDRVLNKNIDIENKNILLPPVSGEWIPNNNNTMFGQGPYTKKFSILLVVACRGGNIYAVKLLFKYLKISIYTIDQSLIIASNNDHLNIVKYLQEDDEVKEMRNKRYN